MIAGTLEIQMMANMARLQADMEAARSSVTGAMGAIESAVGMAQKALMGLAAGASVGMFVGMVQGAIEAQAELKRMSDRTGAAVESLSALKSIAKRSQTDFEEVGGGVQKLAKSMVAAEAGTGKQAEAFAALGISAKVLAANMNDPGQMMLVVAQHMAAFADGARKDDIAMALMGKSGANLLPMMKDLGKQTELVGKVTAAQAEEAEKFVRLLGQWGAKWKELYSVIATAVLPVLNDLFGAMVKGGGIAKTLTEYVKQLADSGKLRDWAQSAKEALDLLTSAFGPAVKVAAAYFAIFTAAPVIFAAVTAAVMPLVNAMVVYAVNVMIGHAATVGFNTVLFGTSVSAQMAAGSLTALSLGANLLFAAFAGWQVGTWLRDNFVEARIAGLTFVGLMLTAWENMKYAAEMVWEGIKFAAEKSINVMKALFADYLSGVAAGLKFVGAVDTSKQVEAYAESLRKGAASQKTFTEQTAGITAAHKKELAAIDANIVDMVRYEIVTNDAAKATAKHASTAGDAKKALKELGSTAGAIADKDLDAMQALIKATQGRIAVLHEQAKAMEPLTEGQKKEAELLAMSTAGYTAAALAKRTEELALLKVEIALEGTATARKADADAMQKYMGATQSNIAKLQEEAEVQRLGAVELQKITAARQIEKAATEAMFRTRVDEFGVVQKVLAATPQMTERILLQAEADKKETSALIEKIAAQKLSLQYEEEISQLKIDSTVYFDNASKALAMLEREVVKRKAAIAALKEESAERAKLQDQFDEWYQASQTKIAADKFQEIWRSVDQTAHDTFVNIFNGGQDAFTKLRDTLKATLLDLLYQMTIKKWIFQIFANVTGEGSGMAGGASGSGGVTGLINTGKNLNSMYNYASKGYNYLFGGAGSASGTGGQAAIYSDYGYTGELGSTAGSAGSLAGGSDSLAAIYSDAGYTGGAVEAGSAAASTGEIMAAGSSAGPWGMVVAAIIAILASRDASRVSSTGDSTSQFDASGHVVNRSNQLFGGDQPIVIPTIVNGVAVADPAKRSDFTTNDLPLTDGHTQEQLDALYAAQSATGDAHFLEINAKADKYLESLNTTYLAAAKALGVGAVGTNFTFGANDSSGGKARLGVSAGGMSFDSGDFAITDAELKLAASRAILTALEGSDLPEWMKGVFDGVNAATLDQAGIDAAIKSATDLRDAYNLLQLIPGTDLANISFATLNSIKGVANELVTVDSAFYQLGYTMLDVSKIGGEAAAGLIAAFGSVQAFQQQESTYFQNYRTAGQQQDAAYAGIQADLQRAGISVSMDQLRSASRADIGAAVDSLSGNVGTTQGQAQYAAAVKAANALASMKPALDAVAAVAPTVARPEVMQSGSAGSMGVSSAATSTALTEWQRATQAIVDTMTDLRMTILGTGVNSYAQMQAQFAIEVAQAKAGDLAARQDLPQLAKAIAAATKEQGGSATEQALVIARMIKSLGDVANVPSAGAMLSVPQFEVGTNRVPYNMLAMLHANEAVVPAAYNPAVGGMGFGGNDTGDVVEELRAVKAELSSVKSFMRSVVESSGKTASLLGKVTRQGQAMQIEADDDGVLVLGL